MHFRAGVVAVVVDTQGRIMAFERSDLPGQWQLPQGGIDVGEEPRAAAWRELGEETGLGPEQVELVGEHPRWTTYEWPVRVRSRGKRLGQAHRWFTFRVLDDAVEPTPDGHEFRAWRWATSEWLIENVADFRRESYTEVLGGSVARP